MMTTPGLFHSGRGFANPNNPSPMKTSKITESIRQLCREKPCYRPILWSMAALAVFSLIFNILSASKTNPYAETNLIQTIEAAKYQAYEAGKIQPGMWLQYRHLAPFLPRANGTVPPIESFTHRKKNQTRKNLISWGTFQPDGSGKPATLGNAPPTTR